MIGGAEVTGQKEDDRLCHTSICLLTTGYNFNLKITTVLRSKRLNR